MSCLLYRKISAFPANWRSLKEIHVEELSYAKAGVDTRAGDTAVELMKEAVRATYTANVFGDSGGFAGMIDASALKEYERPLLATSTDGVGTKIEVARALDIHHTIGQDLVAMVVDDIAVVGAKPLLMTDYIACGRVQPERIARIVKGIADACALVDTPLIGGETAEHPGVMEPDQYDIAGAVTGVVEASKVLGPQKVQKGDILVALAASGLHSNGYSLVRKIVEQAGWKWERHFPEFGRTLGEELLEPTRLYSALCLKIAERVGNSIHAFSHITGGGLGANLSRVMPASLAARIDLTSWQVPAVFQVLRNAGKVTLNDAAEAWNMGVGMVAVCSPEAVEKIVSLSEHYQCPAWVLGEVVEDPGNETDATRIAGTKGVRAGAALLEGTFH
ncbi:phosphoribosylformylglycinamidine cyclo-ligase [Actinomycetaceae bacterium TAE3-ERU4]|nr:phosphoribosylformylglycinamidine cyclo-ligase [Actinomycetaceae bacterium TAE3-ERU4]